MTKKASNDRRNAEHRSERNEPSEHRGDKVSVKSAGKNEDGVRHEPAEERVSDTGPKARQRATVSMQFFGKFPAIH